MATKTRAELEAEAVRVLRAIRALSPDDRDRRTILIRDLARTLVDLREHFFTESGDPDWGARTWEYRQSVRDIYGSANIPHDDAQRIQATTRYHVGNVLRERLSPDQLADLGLGEAAPRERIRKAHEVRSALIVAAEASAPRGADPDVMRALLGAQVLLDRITPERVAELPSAERRRARTALRKIVTRAETLRAV